MEPNYNNIQIKTPKKVLVALPAGLLSALDTQAKTEYRTRSDAIREAIRRYLKDASRENGAVINVQEYQ